MCVNNEIGIWLLIYKVKKILWFKLLMVYFIWYIYMDEIFIGVKVIIIVLKNFECIVWFYLKCLMRKMCID